MIGIRGIEENDMNNMNKVEISMHMTVFSKGFDMSFLSRVNK
jgi:hypothetical protein